ncbi:vanadium-dependent haloperoxidase [Halodurantibacterium flavum]|uniref:Vanadium-dependent haloperoxidase n=1 Tax=Halodurantibacterium flavum TaxID=1382802 RepID=A0ABW4S7E1_9RHOB
MAPVVERRGTLTRRGFLAGSAGGLAAAGISRPLLAAGPDRATDVLLNWYRLVLELVRHTATYSPPVASRSFAYLGVTAHEVFAATGAATQSLGGQLQGLNAPPADPGCDTAATLNAALLHGVRAHFGNTGPTGQRAMDAMEARLAARAQSGLGAGSIRQSQELGEAIAHHIAAWAAEDGGAEVANMGFPLEWPRKDAAGIWVPTSTLGQQQAPLLPHWGANRSFAMPGGGTCGLPPPPDYSEEAGSAFYAEALEVFEVTTRLTDEQKLIARFWSDDPMLSPTPPGHWIAILLQIAERDGLPPERIAAGLALLGVAVADAFIACWHEKYRHDLVRPVTYIRKVIDPAWQPLLITPPFPEYPSGHSTQSGAAVAVLESLFGTDFAFVDTTHVDDGLPARSFPSFRTAGAEAGISRLYGGIHFRAAIERGLEQGYCVGAYAAALQWQA